MPLLPATLQPRIGMLATVRNRRGIVTGVEAHDGGPDGRLHLVSVEYFDSDGPPAHSGDRDAGIAAFCNQNDGDGWMLPETLRLADYGLGHDERAKQPQPVASRLGPRFLPWQLEMSVEESWAECERHARNLLGEEGFARLKAEIAAGESYGESRPTALRAAETRLVYDQAQGSLFTERDK